MPMRGELAPAASRDRWRGADFRTDWETDPAWRQIVRALKSLDAGTAFISVAGLLLTMLAMLLFPVSAAEIAVMIAQNW